MRSQGLCRACAAPSFVLQVIHNYLPFTITCKSQNQPAERFATTGSIEIRPPTPTPGSSRCVVPSRDRTSPRTSSSGPRRAAGRAPTASCRSRPPPASDACQTVVPNGNRGPHAFQHSTQRSASAARSTPRRGAQRECGSRPRRLRTLYFLGPAGRGETTGGWGPAPPDGPEADVPGIVLMTAMLFSFSC
jgi:hypothetical protein